jgi:hypothetical protein
MTMTSLIIQTEDIPTTAPIRHRFTIADAVEPFFLHIVRFIYGMWTSPHVWFVFGILAILQHPQVWWMEYVRDLAVLVFLANFGRLWELHNAARKAFVKKKIEDAKS